MYKYRNVVVVEMNTQKKKKKRTQLNLMYWINENWQEKEYMEILKTIISFISLIFPWSSENIKVFVTKKDSRIHQDIRKSCTKGQGKL